MTMHEPGSVPDLDRLHTLVELRRYAQAEEGLRRLLAVTPYDVEAMVLLVDVLDELDRHDEGLVVARRAVLLAPDSADTHRVLCQALLRAGSVEEAVQAAKEGVRLAPHDWTTHYTLGLALRSGRRARFRDALGAANEAVRLAPHSSHAHNLAGMCLDDLRMYDEAQRAYAEALRLDPQNTMALNNMAALHLNSGRLTRASGFLSAGLSSDAQEKILHQNYDAILLKLTWRLYIVALGFAAAIAITAATGPWLVKAFLGVLLVPSYVLVVRGVVGALPRGVQHWARGLFARSRWWERVALAVYLLTSASVLVMAFGTRELTLAIGLGLLQMMRAFGILVIVVLVGRALSGAFRRS